jgi:Reverse transcriptase (RNA-dependent DNA polymerase)
LIIHYFQKNDGKNVTIFLVYVYDLLIKNNEQEIKLIKLQFRKNFVIKDLRYLKYFLGIEVALFKKDLFISQKNVLDLLKETEKLRYKPTSTPTNNKYKFNSEDGDALSYINQFQRLVDKLIYLTVARSNISFFISQVSKFMHAPITPRLEVIIRILRYLKETQQGYIDEK